MVGQPFFEGVVARVVATTASGLCRRAAPRASRAVKGGASPGLFGCPALGRFFFRGRRSRCVGLVFVVGRLAENPWKLAAG